MFAPARLTDFGELDLRQPVKGEQPLADELVERHSGGQHAGARVGDVEGLEQALDRAVFAEGAVQNRKRHLAAEQATGGAHLDLLPVGEPAALALDQDLDHLVARGRRPVGHRGSRLQRDLVLRGAPSRDHGHLHRRFSALGSVVVV